MDDIGTMISSEIWNTLKEIGSIRTFHPGEMIHYQNDSSKELYCLLSGKIKNVVLFANGSEKILNILSAPNLTCETSIVDGGQNICSAIALTECTVSIIPLDRARELMCSDRSFMALVLRVMAAKIRCMENQAQDLFSTIPQRLARVLLNFEQYALISSRSDGSFPITHDELACLLGTTRTQVTEHLNRLKGQHLIETRRGHIRILDADGLKKIAEH